MRLTLSCRIQRRHRDNPTLDHRHRTSPPRIQSWSRQSRPLCLRPNASFGKELSSYRIEHVCHRGKVRTGGGEWCISYGESTDRGREDRSHVPDWGRSVGRTKTTHVWVRVGCLSRPCIVRCEKLLILPYSAAPVHRPGGFKGGKPANIPEHPPPPEYVCYRCGVKGNSSPSILGIELLANDDKVTGFKHVQQTTTPNSMGVHVL